jgi:hypothetical protein
MLNDEQFEALKIRASVCPAADSWPAGEVQVEFMKREGKPSIRGELHWVSLHSAVAEVRDRTLKTLGQMAAVDADKKLSSEGKASEKQKIAEAALAALEKSPALAKAQAAVEQQVAKWNKELAPPVENPTVAAEIRAHVSRLKDGDRLPFVTKHIVDAAPAVLQGPAFLSGLTAAEIDIVRRQYEATRNPAAAEAKSKAMDALAHCEAGWRNAANTIRTRAGLEKVGNGAAAP